MVNTTGDSSVHQMIVSADMKCKTVTTSSSSGTSSMGCANASNNLANQTTSLTSPTADVNAMQLKIASPHNRSTE